MLFYTSTFEAAKKPMVDVIDPGGQLRAQMVENANGSLRLTLNGAENNRTFAGRFLAENLGSAVQHIAFSTTDIFATLEKMITLGFEPLQISSNYYDDLEVRFGLDKEFSDRLRQKKFFMTGMNPVSIFNFTDRIMATGFIFEIVERRKGY